MQNFLFIRTGKEYTRIFFSEIIYIESLKNYVRVITAKGSHMILVTMNRVEEAVPKNQFCRIHRSYIVALKFITTFNHDRVRIHEKSLPISEQYRKILFGSVLTLEGESKKTISSGTMQNKTTNEFVFSTSNMMAASDY